jgi:hypothetical protein
MKRSVSLAVIVLILGAFVLGPGRIDAFPTMGKTCSSCHTGGSSGSVETRDAAGAAKTAFSTSPSGTVTIVVIGEDVPDSGAFVGLEMGSSYDIVQSFKGATNSPAPGTLYVVNNDVNDQDSADGTVKASMNLTIRSTAAEGIYSCVAVLGYEGPKGVRHPSQLNISVISPVTDKPPAIGTVDFPASVLLNTPIRVVAPITDDNGVAGAVLSYKATVSAPYSAVNMSLASGNPKNGSWEADIPGQTVPGTVYFHINATDGNFSASSPNGSAGNDHSVQVSAPGNPVIAHQPVGTAYIGVDILIEATVTDAGTGVILFYKEVGATAYVSVPMNKTTGGTSGPSNYTSIIPAQPRKGFVSYHINATNGTLGVSTPEYRISVISMWEPELEHVPVTTAYIGTDTVLTAIAKNSANVVLWYKGVGDDNFRSKPMEWTGGGANGSQSYSAALPAQAAKGSMSYYLNATNGTLGVTTPEYRIMVISLWEPELDHVPVKSVYTGTGTVLTANAKNSAAVVMWYKGTEDDNFRSRPMERTGGVVNGSQTYTAALPAQNAPGTMSYYLNATNGTLFNSTKVFSVQVAEAFDLVLLKVTFSEGTPAVHEELMIKARIWNNSTRELTGVQVSFLDEYYPAGDARYIGLVSNLTIPRNATIDVRVWWLPQVNGTHLIHVRADSTGVISEVDEDNNELVTATAVRPALVEEWFPLVPTAEELLGIWPVFAVAAGVAIGVAAHMFRRRPQIQ